MGYPMQAGHEAPSLQDSQGGCPFEITSLGKMDRWSDLRTEMLRDWGRESDTLL